MLRYTADLRSLAFVAIYFSIVAVSWVYYEEMSWWLFVPLLMLNAMFSFFCAVIVHNTIHAPVFKSKILNRIFQTILSFTYGHPVSAFVPGHNLSHHKELSTQKDIMRPTKARFKINFFNYLFFMPIMSSAITSSEVRFIKRMREHRPKWFRQYMLELVLVFGTKITLLVLFPVKTIVLILLPHLYAVWGIVGTNIWQHDGCDPSHPYNHSRNFRSKILNFFAFNNGYHGMHHMRPGLHWSELPAAHEKNLAPFIHPNLNRVSLTAFLWKATIWPGKRLDYLGNPVVLGPETEDMDWVADVKIAEDAHQYGAV